MSLPGTKTLTLEEMIAFFGERVVVHLMQNGKGLVEIDAIAELEEKTEAVEVESVVSSHQARSA